MKKILILLPLLILSACESTQQKKRDAAYWQRSDVESALYMRGPKAQHQLHKDIADCVTSVKELVRLGTIAEASPPARIEMNVGLAENWQSPKGDGPLHTEYREYADFESCMDYKGWNRAAYVKPEIMQRAHRNYNTVILGKSYDVNANPQAEVSHEHNSLYNQ
jgi:hypothetical protein